MSVPNNAKDIFNFLVKGGLTPIAAAGVLGNIANESSGNLNSVGSGGCGLIGYTPCSSAPPGGAVTTAGPNPPVDVQVGAVLAYIQNSYPGGISALNKIGDPATAGASFAQFGERCAECGPGGAQTKARGQNAQDIYTAFQQGTLGNPTQGTADAASQQAACIPPKAGCNPCDGININPFANAPFPFDSVPGLTHPTNFFNGCNRKALTAGLLIGAGGFVALAGAVLIAAYGLTHTGVGRTVAGAASTVPGVGRGVSTVQRVASGRAAAPSRARSRAPATSGQVATGAGQAGRAGIREGQSDRDQAIDDAYYSGRRAQANSQPDESKRVTKKDVTVEGAKPSSTKGSGAKRRPAPPGKPSYRPGPAF